MPRRAIEARDANPVPNRQGVPQPRLGLKPQAIQIPPLQGGQDAYNDRTLMPRRQASLERSFPPVPFQPPNRPPPGSPTRFPPGEPPGTAPARYLSQPRGRT